MFYCCQDKERKEEDVLIKIITGVCDFNLIAKRLFYLVEKRSWFPTGVFLCNNGQSFRAFT